MYHTPKGVRVLLGAERRFYEQSLGMIVDLLATGDMGFDIELFDHFQQNQKLFVLYKSGRGLLRPDEPSPKITAGIEAAIATVYEFAEFKVCEEIDKSASNQRVTFWRDLVLEAAREQVELDEVPDATSCDKEEWGLLLECLAGCVLWDNDYKWQENQDLPPEESKRLYDTLGIDEDYYTDVPEDPPDEQTNLYLDALMGLTANAR